MAQVSQQDLQFINSLKERTILENIDPQIIGGEAIIIRCADCDQSSDREDHFRKVAHKAGVNCRPHVFSDNGGGGLYFDPSSPLVKESQGIDRHKIKAIHFAVQAKNLTKIVLEIHVPCGAATYYNLSLEDQLVFSLNSVKRLKEEFKGVKKNNKAVQIALWLHIDDNDDKKTYHVSTTLLRQFFASRKKTKELENNLAIKYQRVEPKVPEKQYK